MLQFIIKSVLLMGAMISLVSCTSNSPPTTSVTQANNLMAQGLTQFERGEFASAAADWQLAADLYEQSGNINSYINALIRLSDSYQRLGHYSQALSVLEDNALKAAEHIGNQEQIAAVLGNLGQLRFLLGQRDKAQSDLNQSIQLAKQAQQPALHALGLLHLGQVLAAQQGYSAAQSQFTQSVKHDGKQFLIEQYALVTTTGVTLTAPTSNTLTDESISVLASGLTQVTPEIKVQGYPALMFADEISDFMQQQYPQDQRQLQGEWFTYPHLQDELTNKPYRLLNITSHAQFARDFDNTFIVTYDNKMKINQLEDMIKTSKYRDNPLELLTLSACETAKGDERAALGLSGVALKAGARSALATLWKSKEDVAYHLTVAFYQHLKQFDIEYTCCV